MLAALIGGSVIACGSDCEDPGELAERVAPGTTDCGEASDVGPDSALAAVNACVDGAVARGDRFSVRYRVLGVDSALTLTLQHEADGALHRYWTDAYWEGSPVTVERGVCEGAPAAQRFTSREVRDCVARAVSRSVCD